MLDIIIILVVSCWFLIIPLILEILYFIKEEGPPSFFRTKPSTRFIVLGLLLFIPLFTININLTDMNSNKILKVYTSTCVIVTVVWEILKNVLALRYLKSSKYAKDIKVCLAIDNYVGEDIGYNLIEDKLIPKSIWIVLRYYHNSDDFNDLELVYLRDYLGICRRRMVKSNNILKLRNVIKMEFHYLDKDGSVSEFYKECINSPSSKEQQGILNMIKSKPALFKFKKEIFL